MKKIETTIEINAPQEKVWQILADFNSYGAWNPFIQSVKGELKMGGKLNTIIILNGKENHFAPEITRLSTGVEFEWLGKSPLSIFNGRHYFKLEKVSEQRTKLIHGEFFTGWLHAPILWMIGADTKTGFEAMNNALKQRAEKLN